MPRRELDRHQRIARITRRLRRWAYDRLPQTFPVGTMQFFSDAPRFFEALFASLSAATSSICLEYYLIRADRTGARLAEELTTACRRGIQVYLIYDYIGCLDTPESYFRNLRQQGVHCLAFNPPSFRRGIRWFDRRDHRKLVVIDGRLAYLGGCNIGDEYAGISTSKRLFHDVGFSLTGPALTYLHDLFVETWEREQGERPLLPDYFVPASSTTRSETSISGISLINGGPHQRRSAIRAAFRFAMATATDELLIANPYFIPGPLILRSLLRAARRGVQIRLLLPAQSDVPIVRLVSRYSYEQLLQAGIEIYEMQREFLHAKLMLVDGIRTVIGSANLDQRSFHRNYEINAIILSRSFGNQVQAHLTEDFKSAKQITLAGHTQRGIATRLLEQLFRPLSWFL